MNTFMWSHPLTAQHLKIAQNFCNTNVHLIDPIEKVLMCGDRGVGAMAEPATIVRRVLEILFLNS